MNHKQSKLQSLITLAITFFAFPVFAQDSLITLYKVNVVDTFWGVPVADPYRWLESVNSDTTQLWLKEQRKITRRERLKFEGKFMAINSKMAESGNFWYPSYEKQGPYYFEIHYQTNYTSPVLFYKKKMEDAESVAYDPNNYFSKKQITIQGYSLSSDSQNLAIILSKAGSDWRQIVVHNMRTGKNLNDTINWVKFSNVVWFKNGFFYSRYKNPNEELIHIESNTNQQLCYHKIGTRQKNDEVLYTVPDKANTVFSFEKTSNEKYLIIYTSAKISGKWRNIVAYKDLEAGVFAEMKLFIASDIKEHIDYNVVDFINDKFIVHTNLEAPHYRVLAYHKDSINYAEPFIPEYKEVLRSVYHKANKIYCLYFNKGSYAGVIFNEQGELENNFRYPEGLAVSGFAGEPNDSIISFYQTSFYVPPVLYSLNLNTIKAEVINQTLVYYNADNYKTTLVNYKSKDGTEIPMYLTYKKGLKLTNNNPVLLYGYGGFGISMEPFFDFSNIIFFENNGILAVPLIRGGGELGKEWHEQGRVLNKQNTFDDFIAAAQYLVDSGYTSPDHLAIKGGSHGGLVVTAAMIQRPDLFKVVIAEVGVYDMLRRHLFTGGRFNSDEYGSVEDSIQFRNLLKYSPLHNIKSNTDYPATLLITAENDDRVPPLHSYKFLATLQEKSTGLNPHILYFEEDAGHQGAGTIDKKYSLKAFELAFIFKQMHIKAVTGF